MHSGGHSHNDWALFAKQIIQVHSRSFDKLIDPAKPRRYVIYCFDSVVLVIFAKNLHKTLRVKIAVEQSAAILHRPTTNHVELSSIGMLASGVAVKYTSLLNTRELSSISIPKKPCADRLDEAPMGQGE